MTFAGRPKLITGQRDRIALQRRLAEPWPICKNTMYVSSENPMVGAIVYSSAEGVLLANSQRSGRNLPDSWCCHRPATLRPNTALVVSCRG